MTRTNWAGNIDYSAARWHEPTTGAEVQRIVAAAPGPVRAVGSRHSFNAIADTAGDLVSTAGLDRVLALDDRARTVTVEGGIRYGELAVHLHERGWALANLASLPHISVAGAVATGTHGSGVGNGNLGTAVRAVELVTGGGQPVRFESSDPELDGAVVHLGSLGIVTELTLAIEPTYTVAQDVHEHLPMAAAVEHLDDLLAGAYSVSLFTTWRDDEVQQVWRKRRVDGAGDVPGAASPAELGAVPATRRLHPIAELDAGPCTEQLGVPGPWHERLPHFRLGATPSRGDELQSEWFVDRRHAAEALRALAGLAPVLAPLVLVSEIRAIAADGRWLSPCFERPSVAFHMTWVPSWSEVAGVLPRVEAALAPFAPRPHWGKLFALPAAAVRAAYPRLGDMVRLAGRLDPEGVFRNPFVHAYLA